MIYSVFDAVARSRVVICEGIGTSCMKCEKGSRGCRRTNVLYELSDFGYVLSDTALGIEEAVFSVTFKM